MITKKFRQFSFQFNSNGIGHEGDTNLLMDRSEVRLALVPVVQLNLLLKLGVNWQVELVNDDELTEAMKWNMLVADKERKVRRDRLDVEVGDLLAAGMEEETNSDPRREERKRKAKVRVGRSHNLEQLLIRLDKNKNLNAIQLDLVFWLMLEIPLTQQYSTLTFYHLN